ncbi:camp-binding domain-like protein [Tilletiaria anomala UBC 951]|uniref:Camp-binding domain-like protein n=1 Tax=Tilletiaria anomala (strain ATCC 24038 / CBS 436.72 / UBC 951) TaxID=1037660 RepID=A0A066WR76_TILAU|nr:camp-binding domain-like protein [Tilletiaria anomala UBC 951]KDN53150.1 camp-binding domain-like protein [Tilletiaria anomala UBC 951]
MALSSEYAAILNELNREVLRTRPIDPLQFCANWFNRRLEEQRVAHRSAAGVGAGADASVDPVAPAPTSVVLPLSNTPSLTSFFSSASPFGVDVAGASTPTASPHRGSLDSSSSTDTGDEEIPAPDTPGASSAGIGRSGSTFMPPPSFNFGRRTSVSAESLARASASTQSSSKTVIPKTDAQLARIRAAIGNNLLFRNLEEDQYNDVLFAMKEVKVDPSVAVIEQGAQGDYFYVVESGTLDVYIKPTLTSSLGNSGSVNSESDNRSSFPCAAATASDLSMANLGEKKSSYGPGHSFGELALLYLQPRAATILSTSPCTLWALDRVTFRSILMETNSRRRALYDSFLKDVALFEHLSDAERAKISDALEVRTYDIGQRPIKQGERGTEFFIIVEGFAEVKKRKLAPAACSSTSSVAGPAVSSSTALDDEMTIGRLGRGDYFGELALLNNAPRAASVVAAAALPGEVASVSAASSSAAAETAAPPPAKKLKVATLSEKAFTRLLGPLAGIMGRYAEERYGPSSTAGASLGPAAGPSGAGGVSSLPIAVSGGNVPASIAPHQTATTAGTWIGGSPFGQPPSVRT